ncbi:MAG: hypothetical protein QOF77_26 [Solirubrobacteraceae bacterium]|nr:hypothetical protein [Solirubrobacteraceae bacterium]
MADDTCGHEGCNCAPREDGYCSDYCAKHGGHEGHQAHECGCGHSECHLEAATA